MACPGEGLFPTRSEVFHKICNEKITLIIHVPQRSAEDADPKKRPAIGNAALGAGTPGCTVRNIFKSSGWKIWIAPMLSRGIGLFSGVCITGLYHGVSA